MQFTATFHNDRVIFYYPFICYIFFIIIVQYTCTNLFRFFSQTIIRIPSFYHKEWAPDYPQYVDLKYDGGNYEIRVRRHKTRCYLADGLENFRRELEIYESTIIKFFACNHLYEFNIHFTPPLHR